jgi:hypothetical protein
MNKGKWPLLAATVVLPTTSFAAEGVPWETLAAVGIGGAVGGFVGALFACWLCCRRRAKDDANVKKY